MFYIEAMCVAKQEILKTCENTVFQSQTSREKERENASNISSLSKVCVCVCVCVSRKAYSWSGNLLVMTQMRRLRQVHTEIQTGQWFSQTVQL